MRQTKQVGRCERCPRSKLAPDVRVLAAAVACAWLPA